MDRLAPYGLDAGECAGRTGTRRRRFATRWRRRRWWGRCASRSFSGGGGGGPSRSFSSPSRSFSGGGGSPSRSFSSPSRSFSGGGLPSGWCEPHSILRRRFTGAAVVVTIAAVVVTVAAVVVTIAAILLTGTAFALTSTAFLRRRKFAESSFCSVARVFRATGVLPARASAADLAATASAAAFRAARASVDRAAD